MELKSAIKNAINKIAKPFGCRIVNLNWGPLGFAKTLEEIRNYGVQIKSVIDIGASTGVWTTECMQVFPKSDYLLIDPLKENSPVLKSFSDRHPRCRYWNGAIGSSEGELEMHVHGDRSSFFECELKNNGLTNYSVNMRTLDNLVDQLGFPPPDLIKADVQGYELEVLKGAVRCLRDCKILLLECSIQEVYSGIPLAAEVIQYAFSQGFHIYDICSYAQRPKDGKLAQADIVFAKSSCSQLFSTGWNS